jgi:hypothetical protein
VIKTTARAAIIVDALKGLKLKYPEPVMDASKIKL